MAWPLPDGAVLAIAADRPDAPGLPPEARLAMLLDTLDQWDSPRTLASGGRRVLLFGPDDAGPWFDEFAPASFALQPKEPTGTGFLAPFLLGEFADGADRVVIIRADAPTLDPTLVVSAFLCLEGRDLVIGPSTSGGCYLVGARRGAASTFEGIDPGSADAVSRLVDRIGEDGPSLAVLPPWYMVATAEQWHMLGGHLKALAASGTDLRLPRVREVAARVSLAG